MSRSLLILANSARMLAQSAMRGGYRSVAIDRFADLDTRAACVACYRTLTQDFEALKPVLHTVLAEHQPIGWVYGSGFDALLDLNEWLSGRCPLFGNRAQAARICTRPREFFSLLDALAIPYPETRWTAPCDWERANWLIKRGGEGGIGVSVYRGQVEDGGYYQRRLGGKVYTLAFLAGAGRVWWHGFNTLYQENYNARCPFLFAGAINRADLPGEIKRTAVGYAETLSQALGLRGLHGLDFMLDGGAIKVLELNPRPGAALGLWDEALPQGLLWAQIQICAGRKVDGFLPVEVKGFRIVFASRQIKVPRSWQWPSWCADLPAPGTEVSEGGPICSVIASGHRVDRVEEQLNLRVAWVRDNLEKQTVEREKSA
ncbi:MAG: ATP-grasp domain-containing protein [Methylohalobius sp.]|nr:ATP-grasp domain-containing protein [Methylohalobius sp.]